MKSLADCLETSGFSDVEKDFLHAAVKERLEGVTSITLQDRQDQAVIVATKALAAAEKELASINKQIEGAVGPPIEIKAKPEKEAKKFKGKVTQKREDAVEGEIKVEQGKEEKIVKTVLSKKEADTLTLKQQGEYLIAEVDKSLEVAPKELSDDESKQFVLFEVPGDGKYRIVNTKATLQKFKKQAKSLLKVLPKRKPSKLSMPGPSAHKKEKIENLIISKNLKGYFSDGYLLIKGVPPKTAKYGDDPKETIPKGWVKENLNLETKPAELKYFYYESYGDRAVSKEPVPQLSDEKSHIPLAAFKANDKIYVFDQFRFNAIRNRFPDTDYGITEKGILIAYKNKKPVAALMQVRKEKGESFAKEAGIKFSAKLPFGKKPIPKYTAIKAVEPFVAELKANGLPIKVTVAKDKDDLTFDQIKKIRQREKANVTKAFEEGRIRGLYIGPVMAGEQHEVILFANALFSPEDAITTFFHEVKGHYSLRQAFGSQLNPFLDEVYQELRKKKEFPQLQKDYGLSFKKSLKKIKDRRNIAEEYLARIAETNENPGLIKRLIAKIREILRIKFNIKLSDNDIRVIVANSAKIAMKREAAPKTGVFEFAQGPPQFQATGWHGQTKAGEPITEFDPEMIGSGAGLALGWGVYVSEEEGVGRFYADMGRGRIETANADKIKASLSTQAKKAYDLIGEDITAVTDEFEAVDILMEAKYILVGNQSGFINDDTIKQVNKVRMEFEKAFDLKRNLYEVTLGKDLDDLNWLEWDKPASEKQRSIIADALKNEKLSDKDKASLKMELSPETITKEEYALTWGRPFAEVEDAYVAYKKLGKKMALGDGTSIYQALSRVFKSDRAASEFLNRAGIDGVKAPVGYFGGKTAEGKSNYVIFDPSKVKIAQHIQFSIDQPTLPEATTKIKGMEAFRKWFGDTEHPLLAKKNGDPIEVYRGMSKSDYEKGIVDSRKGKYGSAVAGYFTNSPEGAQHYADRILGEEGIVEVFYVKAESVFEDSDLRFLEEADKDFIEKKTGQTIDELDNDILPENKKFIKALKAMGYDAISTQGNYPHTEICPFESEQIKSIFNRGTWSPTDPRISYSIEEPFDPHTYVSRIIGEDAVKIALNPIGVSKKDIQDRQKRAEKAEQDPMDVDNNAKVFQSNLLGMIKSRFVKKNGDLDTDKIQKLDGGLKWKIKRPDDLYKVVRRFQTMQDLANTYPEMARFLDIDLQRKADTNQMTNADREIVEAYYGLKRKRGINAKRRRQKVADAIWYGDEENKILSNTILKDKFNLDNEERSAYWAVRKVFNNKLDLITKMWIGDVTEIKSAVDVNLIFEAIKKRNTARTQAYKGTKEGRKAWRKEQDAAMQMEFYKRGAEVDLTPKQIKILTDIAKFTLERRAYAPHVWGKNWRARVTDKDGKEWMFDVPTIPGNIALTREQRDGFALEKAKKVVDEKLGLENVVGTPTLVWHVETPQEISRAGSAHLMESIIQTAVDAKIKDLGKGATNEEVEKIEKLRDSMTKTIKELYLSKGAGQHLIRRKNVAGYRRDLDNILSQYLSGFNAFFAKGKASKEYMKAMKDVKPSEKPEMWLNAKEFIEDTLAPAKGEAVAYKRFIGGFFLAGDVSAASLNMMQNWTHALALLRGIPKAITGKKHPVGEKELSKAMHDVIREFVRVKRKGWFKPQKYKMYEAGATKYIEPKAIEAMREALERGQLDPQLFGERTGLQSNKLYMNYVNRAERALYFMFTGAESLNRMSTFLATYRRCVRSGMVHDEARRKAAWVTREAHFLYTRSNRPPIIRKMGTAGNMAYTFMAFPMQNLAFLKHRFLDIKHARSREERILMAKVLTSHLVYLFSLGGIAAMPFAWLGAILWKLVSDDDPEELLREYTAKLPFKEDTSQPVGRTIARGIPAALGNDMSWRLEGTDILGIPIGIEAGKTVYKRGKKGVKLFREKDYWNAVFHFTPDMFYNPALAVLGYKEGGERQGVPPIKYTKYEAITKFTGHTPTREAETYKAGGIARTDRKRHIDQVAAFSERYLYAQRKNSAKLMADLKRDWGLYNRKQRKMGDKGLPISWKKEVVAGAKRRRTTRAKGYFEKMPKYMGKRQRGLKKTFGLEDETKSRRGTISRYKFRKKQQNQ